MIKEENHLTLEIVAGTGIFAAAAMLIALFVYPKPSVFAGLLLGVFLSLAMFFSMALILKLCIKAGNQKFAAIFSIISSMTRYLILLALVAVVIKRYSVWFHPIALIVGVFGIKAGTFLQPVIHRFFPNK
ncbi:ATP synthase subunit I [Lacrimispora sp. JR3]|uniref:ATP synthase subunit I n=1 Tax=Lacrimispora sinapis TaxID=3111456 RepID=UPI00374A8254